jgi:hypothetical protein
VILIMLLAQPEERLAGGTERRLLVTTDGCSVSSFPGARQALSLPFGAFLPTRLDEFRFSWPNSIAAEAAWRLDADEVVEIEIDDSLQGGGGSGVTQIVQQHVVPGGVFGLQGDKPGDRVVPALFAGAPVGWPPLANHRRWLLGLTARAVTRLAFGVAERVLTFGLSAFGHGLSTVM